MKIHLYATLRDVVGARTLEISAAEGLTAQALFEEILRRYPRLRKEMLNESGRLYGHVHFFINGRDVQFIDGGWQVEIKPEDEITLFPAIGGG